MIPENYIFTYPWLPVDTTKKITCCLCNGVHKTEDVFIFSINDKKFSIRYCIKDKILFLYPQPAGDYTEKLYNHQSYFTGEDDMYGLAISDEKSYFIAKTRIQEIIDYLNKNNQIITGKSFLEIGSAYGHTLEEAHLQGVACAHGIEFSRNAVNTSNKKQGTKTFLGSVNENFGSQLDQSYDIITMYSVLEHVNDPLSFLCSITKFLQPDGIIIIRVPKMSKQEPWLSLFDHFWHFTEESIVHLLKKSDLNIETIFPSGTFSGTQHSGKLESMTFIAKKL